MCVNSSPNETPAQSSICDWSSKFGITQLILAVWPSDTLLLTCYNA
jgi:hypothetical protein